MELFQCQRPLFMVMLRHRHSAINSAPSSRRLKNQKTRIFQKMYLSRKKVPNPSKSVNYQNSAVWAEPGCRARGGATPYHKPSASAGLLQDSPKWWTIREGVCSLRGAPRGAQFSVFFSATRWASALSSPAGGRLWHAGAGRQPKLQSSRQAPRRTYQITRIRAPFAPNGTGNVCFYLEENLH